MSKPICVLQAPLFTRSGYGDLGLAIAKSLIRYDKFETIFVPTRWGACSKKYNVDEIKSDIEKEIFNKALKQPLTKQPELFIQCTIPNEFVTPAKYNIGITAGIETTAARAEWIDGLNRMNLNLVTSNHAKKVFDTTFYKKEAQNGQPAVELKSTKPMEVLFWGVDTNIFKKTNEKIESIEEEFKNIKEDFCFLFVGQWTNSALFGDRKDIGNLIKTFLETFSNLGDKAKPALILKTSGASICNIDKHDMIKRLRAIKQIVENEKGTKDLPNVYLLYGELESHEMNALYNHEKVKAHVSFTHGEGYGMPLLEASLSGKPVLASNWSGHLDFLDEKLCKLLDGNIKPLDDASANEWLIKGSSWFTVDYAKASDSLKNCFHHYGKFLEKSEKLRDINEYKFSEKQMDTAFHSFLDSYVPNFPTEQKLILPKLKKITPQEIK